MKIAKKGDNCRKISKIFCNEYYIQGWIKNEFKKIFYNINYYSNDSNCFFVLL